MLIKASTRKDKRFMAIISMATNLKTKLKKTLLIFKYLIKYLKK